jgi:hypothetical protein
MDVAQLARRQTFNRVAIGTGLIVVPGLLGRIWAGSGAGDPRAKVLSRALGARDLALGVAGVGALREGDREWMRRSFGAQAFVDVVDLVAILAGREVPLPSKVLGGTMAAGSAAAAAAYAARL